MSQQAKKGSLGEILSASQIITESDVLAALEEQKRSGIRFGEALVNLGIVTQEDIDWALSNQLDIPYIRLKKDMIDPEALNLIPADLARTHNFIPLIRAGGELNIAISDPLNRTAAEAVERLTGLSVNISVALIREIREMIDACYGTATQDSMGFASAAFSEKVMETINADLTGGKLLDYLLIFILQNRLSSLSLQPVEDRVRIIGRRSGSTREIGTLALNHYPDFIRRLRMGTDLAVTGEPTASGTFAFIFRSQKLAFHVSLLHGFSGDYVTLKQQIASVVPAKIADLVAPQEQLSAFQGLTLATKGITFFASRSVQERSQFMDLMLEEISTSGKTVIILGDGPGRLQKRFSRIPLPETDKDRARLIMDTLDHDPDVLVIEDVTEGMPFVAACRAAMRGKLVLAGLGIRGTQNVLRHLLLYQQQSFFLPVFVNGLISFKGIQVLCPACRSEYQPPREELMAMHLDQPPAAFYRATGCETCGYSGVSERRFLLDVLPFDDEFLRVFEQSSDVAALEVYFKMKGYHGAAEEGLRLLTAGEVSPEDYIASVVM